MHRFPHLGWKLKLKILSKKMKLVRTFVFMCILAEAYMVSAYYLRCSVNELF